MQEQAGPSSIRLKVKQVIRETQDTRSFILEPIGDVPLQYMPGQFLTFLFRQSGGAEARRSYSLSSTPLLNEPLMITVKRTTNGEYSRRLVDKTKEGDELLTIGASGFFTLPATWHQYEQLIFFAAGSGISPVYALIKTVLYSNDKLPVILIYSNRSPETTIFCESLKTLQQAFPGRFQVIFLFSTVADLSKARLNVDLLHCLFGSQSAEQLGKQLFYLCGPFEYMRMITIALQGHGVPLANIRKEIFNVEKPQKRPAPPDTKPYQVKLLLAGKEYQFEVQYPVTILQAAKSLQIPVPYSCESGQCGTCAATCLKGKVWMWHNDVLLDDEVASGRTLTCTGYPVGGDVLLHVGT